MLDKKRDIDLLAGIIIALVFVAFSLSGLPPFEKWERNIYDLTGKYAGPGDRRTVDITLVDIDDKSLRKLGPWPWPRDRIAEMISLLHQKGAGPIGLNISFIEKETNPGLMEIKTFREEYLARSRAGGSTGPEKWVLEYLDQMVKRLDRDRSLIESVKSHPVILPLIVPPGDSREAADNGDTSFLSGDTLDASHISSSLKERSAAARLASPFRELASSAGGLGHTRLWSPYPIEGRSHPVFIHYRKHLVPSFPLRLAMAYLTLQPGQVRVEGDQMVLKDRSIPLERGAMLFRIHDEQIRFPRLSFADLLKNEKLQAGLKGRIVLIGLDRPPGRQPDIPGTAGMGESGLIAHILHEMLRDGYMARPFFMTYLEILLILLTGITPALFFPRRGAAFRLFTGLGAVVLLLIASIGLSMAGVWFNPVYAVCSLIAVYLYFLFENLFLYETLGDSRETNRLLGLSFQSQGLLDMAFEKFRKLQMNNETKDLIYDLGLEYEKKHLPDKALAVYEYINRSGGFRDLDDRIPRLKASDQSSTLGGYDKAGEPGILSDSEPADRSKVGRYEIISELGRGSMGLVYKAQDPKIHRLVAIKTIRFSDEFDEDVIQEIKSRFFREAEIAGQLSHPSIVTIHDVGEDGDLTYMAMEYLEGEDLDKFTKKEKLLPFRRVLDIVTRIAEALAFAHKANVIHRDIKPANVMLLSNGQIKVTDFGIAKAISSSRTKTGVILGTPNYMSPEQIMGQKIDSKSDIFSLGVLFYQLITGELPFHGENLSGLLYQITQVKQPSPRHYNPKIPRVCEQILDKALDKDPAGRFRSAGDMAKVVHLLGEKIDQLKKKKASG